MQEVCVSLESQMGPQIKSESPLNALQVQSGQTIVPGVTTATQQQHVQQAANNTSVGSATASATAMILNKMGSNCDKRLNANEAPYWMTTSEGGFINSQPSMAEFLNHLSPESPKMIGAGGMSGVGGSAVTPVVGGYAVGVGGTPQTPDGMDSVPEYPWMKEKKTSRKNNNNSNQGKRT